MNKLCPKCGFEGEFLGRKETAACPDCGAVYAKVMKYISSLSTKDRLDYLSQQVNLKTKTKTKTNICGGANFYTPPDAPTLPSERRALSSRLKELDNKIDPIRQKIITLLERPVKQQQLSHDQHKTIMSDVAELESTISSEQSEIDQILIKLSTPKERQIELEDEAELEEMVALWKVDENPSNKYLDWDTSGYSRIDMIIELDPEKFHVYNRLDDLPFFDNNRKFDETLIRKQVVKDQEQYFALLNTGSEMPNYLGNDESLFIETTVKYRLDDDEQSRLSDIILRGLEDFALADRILARTSQIERLQAEFPNIQTGSSQFDESLFRELASEHSRRWSDLLESGEALPESIEDEDEDDFARGIINEYHLNTDQIEALVRIMHDSADEITDEKIKRHQVELDRIQADADKEQMKIEEDHKKALEDIRAKSHKDKEVDQNKNMPSSDGLKRYPSIIKEGFLATQEVVSTTGFFNKSGVALDENRMRICLREGSNVKSFSYSDVLSCDFNEGGDTVTSTSRTSQIAGMAIGGLALGGLGALVGGLTGSKRSASKVDTIDVVVTVNNPSNPVFRINFLNSEVKRNSWMHNGALKEARRCLALVSIAIREADRVDSENLVVSAPSTVNQSGTGSMFIADELLKLNELLTNGILTNEEFEEQKKRLLSS